MNIYNRVRILALSLLIALSVTLAGCTENSSSTESTINAGNQTSTVQTEIDPAQEIAVKALAAIEDLKTLKFDMDMTMSYDVPDSEYSGTMSIQQTGTSMVNIPEKAMAMTVNMTIAVPQQGSQNMSAEIYTLDGWMYMNNNIPGMSGQWTKMQLQDNIWEMQSRLSSMTDFLKSPLKLELAGSESINGVDCYILNINPDMESIVNWMSEQMSTGQTGTVPNTAAVSEMFQSFAVKEWIAKDSYLITRQQINMKLNMDTKESGTTDSNPAEQVMNIDAVLNYYDYNEPTIIQLPDAAYNAQEFVLPDSTD